MKQLVLSLAVLVLATLTLSAAEINLVELKKVVADKSATILDATGTASYDAGHIPGAVDYFGHASDIASKLPADKSTLIVAYCYSPECPAYKQAVAAAEALGYTNVKHFTPGITGWKSAGEPVEQK